MVFVPMIRNFPVWTPTSVPTASDDVDINNGGTAQLQAFGSSRTLTLGFFSGTSGTVQITSGGVLTSDGAYLGFGATATGTMTVSGAGSKWTSINGMNVGIDGT